MSEQVTSGNADAAVTWKWLGITSVGILTTLALGGFVGLKSQLETHVALPEHSGAGIRLERLESEHTEAKQERQSLAAEAVKDRAQFAIAFAEMTTELRLLRQAFESR